MLPMWGEWGVGVSRSGVGCRVAESRRDRFRFVSTLRAAAMIPDAGLCSHTPPPTPHPLLRPNDRVDRGEHFQRLLRRAAGGELGGAVAHDRFVAVLLPPVSDVENLADFSDHELARRGAARLAEL